MTWTYTPDFTLSRDKVRLILGDTVSTTPLVTDEEIAWAVTENNSDLYLAAALLCDSLSGRFASQATTSKTVGSLSLSKSYGEQSTRWSTRAAELRAQAAVMAPPSPTGYVDDDGNVGGTAQFSMGMHTNTGT